jgi:hypothetical protein
MFVPHGQYLVDVGKGGLAKPYESIKVNNDTVWEHSLPGIIALSVSL